MFWHTLATRGIRRAVVICILPHIAPTGPRALSARPPLGPPCGRKAQQKSVSYPEKSWL